jgi:hypothetical protein
MGPEIGKGDDEGFFEGIAFAHRTGHTGDRERFRLICQGIAIGVLVVFWVTSHSPAAPTGGGDEVAADPNRL